MNINRKILLITVFCIGIFAFAQSFAKDHDDKAVNLQVLPKNTSDKELHKIMKEYSIALGVHCNYCHVSSQVEGQERPKMDFASDDKHEKTVAREMMRMVDAINAKYIDKMPQEGRAMEQITCVTCHNGRATPIVSVDSLERKTSH